MEVYRIPGRKARAPEAGPGRPVLRFDGQQMPGDAAMPRAAVPSLSIVIATRNEAENVEALIAAICGARPGSDKELIFVDDSDDSTPFLLQRFLPQADCPSLILRRVGEERAGGLSTAVVAGFAVSGGTYLCNMDGDLQHPASEIPHLCRVAERERADIVVASRYMPDGSPADGLAGLHRHAVSRGARLLSRLVLARARMTSDPLSGFFIVHRRVLEGTDLHPVGYKILLEILVRGRWHRLLDVPYTFQARYAGVSKATMRQGIQFLRHLAMLTVAARFGKRPPLAPMPSHTEGVSLHQVEAEAVNAQWSPLWRAESAGTQTMEARLPSPSQAARGKGGARAKGQRTRTGPQRGAEHQASPSADRRGV